LCTALFVALATQVHYRDAGCGHIDASDAAMLNKARRLIDMPSTGVVVWWQLLLLQQGSSHMHIHACLPG
jgi:hypothetical protein